jgi:hypothetical protein
MLREISETSLSLLIYGPIPEGEQFWMYIPVIGAPNDCVAIWCVVEECKGSGLEDEGYVARASFMDGTPPALPVQNAPAPVKTTRPTTPSRMFTQEESTEVSHSSPDAAPARAGVGGLFLRSEDPAAAPPQQPHETTSEYATTQPQPVPVEYTPPAVSHPIAAPSSRAMELPPMTEIVGDHHEDDSDISSRSKAPLTSRQLRNIAQLIRSQLMNLNRLSQRLDRHKIPDEEALRGDLFNAREAMQQLRMSIQQRRMKAGDRIRRRRRRRAHQAQIAAMQQATGAKTSAAPHSADPMQVPQQAPMPIQAVA